VLPGDNADLAPSGRRCPHALNRQADPSRRSGWPWLWLQHFGFYQRISSHPP